jgi:sigma-B regulation protein RsbU (phosphoserine phosphatase)
MVADVSGHGAPSAIVMAMIRAVLHTYPGVPDDPPAVLHHINRHFRFLWESSMYATAVYGVLDAGRGTLRLSSAGHPPPLLLRPGETASPLPVDPTMCLIWDELRDIPCAELSLRPGDRVVFYTDGITERQASDGSMYDPEQFAVALTRIGAVPAADIVRHIVREVDQFAGGHEPEDDQTLLVAGFD